MRQVTGDMAETAKNNEKAGATDVPAEAHEFLTVRELADMLRIKERKVYDLAASGDIPCSRATGKLLFPYVEIRAWIEKAQSGGKPRSTERSPIFLGSHDPLLDWAIRQSRCGLATYFDGSLDGLSRFCAGEGIATGMHIFDPATSSWNLQDVARTAADQNAVLISFAIRKRGWVVRKDGPRPEGMTALGGLRIVPRQDESGTASLFKSMARAGNIDPSDLTFTSVARTEDDAVQMVRHEEADATFGLQSVAEAYGLDFIPMVEERFDLLIDRKAWFAPPVQTLLSFCRSDAFRRRAASYAGYDIRGLGQVVWNA
jgi:excisionase family DNA binding protein